MSMIQRIAVILAVLVTVTYLSSHPVLAAEPALPKITGKYGVVIDAVTGDVIYSKKANVKSYPASMTKVLTAIILDEKVPDTQMLTVSPYAAGQECSCFGLKAGEQISKNDAMYGLLLLSANDVAVAIAENVGGSVEGFAKLMNEEVAKLGLKNTHFVTPNGLHDPKHYTTSYDMAIIMKEALKHPNVLKALSTQSIKVHTSLQDRNIINTSQVHTQPATAHVIAGKTGFTDQAQNTLVEYLKAGNKQVISVVMKTHKKDQYKDIQKMAKYAFAHMKVETIASKGKVVERSKLNGRSVNLRAVKDIHVSLKKDGNSKLAKKIEWLNNGGKDISKGQVVADLKVYVDGVMAAETPLVTDQAIKKLSADSTPTVETRKTSALLGYDSLPVILMILTALIIWLSGQKRKKIIRK